MPEDFNKSRFFDNISYLIKKHDLKIGEIENSAGVSAGYISRASKDEKSKPGIEFVMKVAELLHVSVDVLLQVDLTSVTPTEKYLISFLDKLNRDTMNDSLDWHRETKAELNRVDWDRNGNASHPLFSVQAFDESNEYDETAGETVRAVFVSHNFDCRTVIYNDCYNLRLKNGTLLYIMNICKTYSSTAAPNTFAIEIWMHSPDECPQFLCDNKGVSAISHFIECLYTSVSENMRHPKINKDLQYVIDAFMHNDIEDDPSVDDIPF